MAQDNAAENASWIEFSALSPPRADLVRRPDRASRLFSRRVRRAPQMARREAPTPTSSRCASSCPARRAARSASRSACRAPAMPGALAAWVGFTLPSALALVLFAYGVGALGDALGGGWLHGLKVVAVAVVAQAVLAMMRSLAPDRERATLAVAAAVDRAGGAVGLGPDRRHRARRHRRRRAAAHAGARRDHAALPLARQPRDRRGALLAVFFALLIGAAAARRGGADAQRSTLFDAFYRAGSLVFGGGHVVLPLLQAAVVPPGWVEQRRVPRRLRRGAGGAGAAVHLRRLSRRRDGAGAERLGRRGALPGRDLPAVVPAGDRRAAVLGRAAAPAVRRSRRCAASTPPWSGCCSPRSTIRCGRRASPAPAISRSASRPSCCCSCGRRRHGWWWC